MDETLFIVKIKNKNHLKINKFDLKIIYNINDKR